MEEPGPSRRCKQIVKEEDKEYLPNLDDISEGDDESLYDSDSINEGSASFQSDSTRAKKGKWQIDEKAHLRALQKVPHECFVDFNITDEKPFENLKCYPSFCATYPRAVYIAKTIPNRLEPCHRRPRQYASIQMTLNRYRTFYQSYRSKRTDLLDMITFIFTKQASLFTEKKKFKLMKKKGAYPSIVFRYAELLASNPDPFFSGRYDWYYTGGNLDVVADHNAVIHVDGSDLKIVTNDVGTKKLQSKVVQMFDADEDEEDPEIFEIQVAPSSKRLTFSVREKKTISIYECKNGMKRKYFFTQKNEPFINSTFDPYEKSNFITSDLSKTVALWDLNTSTKKPKQLLFNAEINEEEKDRNWNCICPFARDTYAFAGLNNLTLLDARVSSKKSTHTFASLEHVVEMCEMFCSLCPSKYENMLYAATTHKIFGLDMRYLGREIDEKFTVLRWVHLLRNPPLLLKMYHREGYELILASSLLSSDMVYCENIKNSESKFTSPSLPFTPPSLQDAYENARSRGQCLNPNARIKERINRCTTGMNFLEQGEALHVMFSSSNGDVFSQRISFAESGKPPSKVESSFAMSLWEDEILNASKNISLNANRVEDLSVMSKIFRCMNLNNPEPEVANEEPSRPTRRQKWHKPIKNLYKYKDALAESLLAIWDVMPEDEKIPDIKTENLTESSKVLSWLLDSTPLPCPEDTSQQPVFDETLFEITPIIKTEVENHLAFDPIPPVVLPNPKVKPKRDRHVPGF